MHSLSEEIKKRKLTKKKSQNRNQDNNTNDWIRIHKGRKKMIKFS